MTRVLWGDAGTRFFETGVDRGVLYLSDQDGVAWNGLTSVEESPSGGEAKPYYQDGIKYLNVSAREEFEATIEAFSAPAEFGPCDGTVSIQNGLFVGQQPRRAFSLSYRTMIGNDLDPQMGYKLHLVYNALASPASRTNATMSDSPEAQTLSWSLTTLPPAFTGYKPTAHFVIDSRKTPRGLLAAIEDILYGSDVADARIPMPSELISMFQSEGPVTRTNYATNPSFRKVNAGTVEVRRNMVMNASYKSYVAAAEMRRNYAVNPGCETTAGYLTNNGTGWTMSQDSSVKKSGTYSMKSTPSATTIGGSRTLGSIYLVGGTTVPSAVGEIWTVSVNVASNASGTTEANLYVQFLDAANAVISTVNGNTFTPIASGSVFSRLSVTTPGAPANTVTIRVLCNVQKTLASGTVLANEFCWFDECLIEKVSTALPYFDGSTPADTGLALTYSWTGTANASASIASGLNVNGLSFKGYIRPAWVKVGGATDGTNSCLTYVASTTTTTAAPSTLLLFNYDGPVFAVGDSVIGRFRARLVNATVPITVLPRLYGYTSAGGGVGQISAPVAVTLPVDGSWVDIVAPTGVLTTGMAQARLYVGMQNGGELYTPALIETSNVLIEKADAAMPWFDGSTPASDGLTYSWSGTAGMSESIATGKLPATLGATPSVAIWQGADGASLRVLQKYGTAGFFEVSSGSSTPVVEGDVVTESFDLSSDAPASVQLLTAQTGPGQNTNGQVVASGVDATRLSLTSLPVTAGATFVRPLFFPKTNGVIYTLRNHLSEKSASSNFFFDGSSVDSDNYFYYWDGAADASTSHVNTWN